jgi:hypothetical protein
MTSEELLDKVEAIKKRRSNYLLANILTIFVLLSLQLVLIYTKLLPNDVMLFYPLLLLVSGGFYVYKSYSCGKQINDLFESYRQERQS